MKNTVVAPISFESCPTGSTFCAVEGASLEEEDTVQDLWAALLFNAHDANSGVKIEKIFVDLLRSIGHAEASLLEALFKANEKISIFQDSRTKEVSNFQKVALEDRKSGKAVQEFVPSVSNKQIKIEIDAIFSVSWRLLTSEVRSAAVQNLFRLRCLGLGHSRLRLENCFRVQRVEAGGGAYFGLQEADTRALDQVFGELQRRINIGIGLAEAKIAEAKTGDLAGIFDTNPELSLEFTPLGLRLMNACLISRAESAAA